MQTPQLLGMYDVIADYLLDCALYFFRDRIEAAFSSRDYAGSGERRCRIGSNDSIYARLDVDFLILISWKGRCGDGGGRRQ